MERRSELNYLSKKPSIEIYANYSIISIIIGQLFQKRKQGEINCEKHVCRKK